AAVPEALVEESGRRHDRPSGREGLGDDPLRDRRADGLDLARREPVRDRPAGPSAALVVLVELEVALVGGGDVDHEPERIGEERLERVLRPDVEETQEEIPLPPDVLDLGHALLYTNPASDTPK